MAMVQQLPDDNHFVDVKPVNKKENRQQGSALYAKRVKIHPRRVKGLFRQLKWYIMAGSLTVYYLAPWIRWDRGPDAPNQAILIDFPARRFYFFFIEIWPHELYYIAGLLIMAGIGLFLTASIVGRAWCGYFCPQTVWVDLFLVVERWVEGDRNKRIRLDRAPWSLEKMFKRAAKHSIWLLIALLTGGAWVFYFADAPKFAVELVTLHAPFVAYATVGVMTLTTYVFGGLMREQVCTYMCPWPRVQGAMVDEDTMTITYRGWRGEPRAPIRTKRSAPLPEGAPEPGDCIDCNHCVVVCPMGIDIRDGQQLECISCGLCIDACNTMMAKVGRPANLIAYDTYRRDKLKAEKSEVQETHLIRPRTLVYIGLWCLVGIAMLFALATRSTIEVNVLRDRNPLYVQLSDGSIRNGFTLKVRNMLPREREMILSVRGLGNSGILMPDAKETDIVVPITIKADSVLSQHFFVVAGEVGAKISAKEFTFRLMDSGDGKIIETDAIFRGPAK